MFKNKSMKSHLIAVSVVIMAIALLSGCEDVIDLNVNEAAPRLVIEAVILDRPSPYAYVLITKSMGPFLAEDLTMVSDAEVIISDDAGNVDTLTEYQPGVYLTPDIEAAAGRSYTASVTVEGETYTSTSVMPEAIEIDSIGFEYQEGGGFGDDDEEGYILHVFFSDRPEIEDYARIKLMQNDSLWERFYLYNGIYSDSKAIDYDSYEDVFDYGDSVFIELYTIDGTSYEYFEALSFVAIYEDGTDTEGVPGNPYTNWDKDVLGYFGAFTLRQESIIVDSTMATILP